MYGYKLSSIEDSLNQNNINSGVLNYISDYYNINIIVLDYNKERYMIGKEYNDSLNEKNVILILNEGIYLPLVNMFGELPTKLLYKCIINKITIDKSNTVEKEYLFDIKTRNLSIKNGAFRPFTSGRFTPRSNRS